MCRALPLLLLKIAALPTLAQVQAPGSWTPADAVTAAARDVAKLPVETARTVQYLDFGSESPERRAWYYRFLSGHVNERSRESDIVLPAIVHGTGGALIRINRDDYGWPRATWERLADVDELYHLKVNAVDEVPWPGGTWHGDGKHYAAGAFRWKRQRTALAPWLAEGNGTKAALDRLIAATGSAAPVVHGPWFIWQTGIQADRGGVGYYDLLRLTKRADAEKLAGFDKGVVKAARRIEFLEAVAESGVAQQPRRIGAFDALGPQKFWVTFDNKLAKGDRNPLAVLDETFKHDAEEILFALPNGWLGQFLCDDKGVRQDSAPDFIGPDTTAHSNDGRIHAGLCMRCHNGAKTDRGLRSIDAWVRNLFQPPLVLNAVDQTRAKRLRQQYARELEGALEDGRRVYARAVGKATLGWTPHQYGQAVAEFWRTFEAPVTLERAARELGTTPALFQAVLEKRLQAGLFVDPMLATYLQPPERRKAIPIRQWFEVYGVAQFYLRGYTPPLDAVIRRKVVRQ